jgi:3-phosphoshikimate 1-carboxyvinyltransferase
MTIFKRLGVTIIRDDAQTSMTITGVGLNGLKASDSVLDVGNSGTAIRLITGVLAAQNFNSTITGDSSIQSRPMKRIIDPLHQMGAQINGVNTENNIVPPLKITGGKPLSGITYDMPVASAQVKSAILLAGLWANGTTTVKEPEVCRDHTERMFQEFGVDLVSQEGVITLTPPQKLETRQTEFIIPSDISSAAFFAVLGCCAPGLEIKMTNIGNNPTRNRVLKVLNEMGASLDLEPLNDQAEPMVNITARGSKLNNITVNSEDIPIIIDEIPILAVAALFGDGPFTVRNAEELRVKESDRIAAISGIIKGIGAGWKEYEDGFTITPAVEEVNGERVYSYHSFELDSHDDHRIAMSGVVAALISGVSATIKNCENINTSFPNFMEILADLRVEFKIS